MEKHIGNNKLRFGNSNTEAFALLMLSSNYRAWLCTKKERHRYNLMMEYNSTTDIYVKSVVDVLMPNLESVLSENQEDKGLCTKTTARYKKLKRDRREWVHQIKWESLRQDKEAAGRYNYSNGSHHNSIRH